ncbi:MAG TPA: site-2 protease family protein [Armatimonadetes bacterium]|nr:site-2 protease family protein [Armatimonadota bacterium]
MLDHLFERTVAEWAFLGLALMIAIPIHEFAHAWAARWAGDDTAAAMGRVTLDPLKHLDPLGTILILIGGFGWGKPVPVNPYNFRSPRWGSLFVSAAGPASNILLALLIGVLGFRSGLLQLGADGFPGVMQQLIWLNLALALFNLIPVPPLDGSKVLLSLLPNQTALAVAKVFDRFGLLMLILLLVTGMLGAVIRIPAILLYRAILGV